MKNIKNDLLVSLDFAKKLEQSSVFTLQLGYGAPKKLAHAWFDVMRLLETCWNNDVDRDRGHLRVPDPDDVRGAGPEVLRDQQRQLDRSGKVQLQLPVSRTRGRH